MQVILSYTIQSTCNSYTLSVYELMYNLHNIIHQIILKLDTMYMYNFMHIFTHIVCIKCDTIVTEYRGKQ